MRVAILLCALSLFLFASTVFAGEILLGAGAGYKKPLEEVVRAYESKSTNKVSRIYGNISQIIEQAKQSGKIDVIVGDERFIDNSKLAIANKHPLGRGKLVLVFSKTANGGAVSDLKTSKITKIAAADPKKAVYGVAATEFIAKSGLNEIEPKMIYLASVPQVSMYLLKGEVDAGFLNISDYIALQHEFGKMVEIDEALYNPIIISAAPLKDSADKEELLSLIDFFESREAKAIFKKYGLE